MRKSCSVSLLFSFLLIGVSALMPRFVIAAPAATLAPVSADVRALATEQRNFPSDSVVDECLAMAVNMQDSIQSKAGRKRQDDTTGLGAIAPVARACGARFTLANIPDDGTTLLALFKLALYEQNDTLAQAILPKLLSPKKFRNGTSPGGGKAYFDRDSGEVLALALESYIDFGKPAAAKALRRMIETQIQAKGSPVYYFFQLCFAFERLSVAWFQRPRDDKESLARIEDVLRITEAREAETDSTKLDERTYTLQWFALADMYHVLERQRADSATVWAFATRALRDLGRYVYATENLHFSYYPSLKDPCRAGGHWNKWENMTIPQLLNAEGFGGTFGERWPAKTPPADDTVWPDSTCIPYGIPHNTPPPFPKHLSGITK